ncbi:MAG: transcriptional repressor [Phycisphaerales bacterium]|jgi:Fur family ferric uptake transcriptional regulator|nr:transcriptional repressor [Phycisphaerales bacterium]MDP6693603.1 transcriptional repressor [Phycisphaerales bacterium]
MVNESDSTPPTQVPDVMAPLCSVFRRYLRSQSLKYTPERADILNAIIAEDGLFEAERLMDSMRRDGYRVSKATLYRTVKLLREAGIIQEVTIDGKQSHYQLIYGRKPIDAIVCMRTGKRIEFSSDEIVSIRNKIGLEQGWEVAGHRFVIYALSPEDN